MEFGSRQGEPEFITEELKAEIFRAHNLVLGFDELTPLEIRQAVAVPRVKKYPDGEECIQSLLTLGTTSRSFADYIKKLKNPDPGNLLFGAHLFELAIFLVVIKESDDLKSLSDYFIDSHGFWHQLVQGISLRRYFLDTIQMVKQEEKTDFYDEAQTLERIIKLTDHIHTFCFANPPLSEYPSGRFLIGAERSWLDWLDGKDIGYRAQVLDQQMFRGEVE